MRRYLLISVWSIIFCCGSLLNRVWAQEIPDQLVFKLHGEVIKTLSIQEIQQQLGVDTATVFEYHENQPVSYKGVIFNHLLELVYGAAWRQAEEVLFTCLDGFQPSVPVDQFKEHISWLAFERVGQGSIAFEFPNDLIHNHSRTSLGPAYLIWENINDKEMFQEGAARWPYQIVTIDLVSFSDRFPHVAPQKGASASVNAGFLSFRQYCMNCHTVNGDGGAVAPELNYPVNVTEYYQPNWLREWIKKPTSIRFNASMPAFDIEHSHKSNKEREKIIDDVLEYLRYMKGHKQKPKQLEGAAH
jgi:mono/diheme cytochrome c family protein